MKETERKLIAELMRNSRRSDRELAKAVGVSQPTVSRMIKKLEKEGIIKEYTMIPDFRKLDYELLGLIFVKLKRNLHPEEADRARQLTKAKTKQSRFALLMVERGLGLGYDGVIMALYEDYAAYSDHKKVIRQHPYLELSDIEGFLISLDDPVHYLPLSLSHVAKRLMSRKEKEEE